MGEEIPGSAFVTRRQFLALAGGATAMLCVGGVLSLPGKAEALVVPPGASSRETLMSRCNRCQKCQEVCPTGVITPVLLRESPAAAGTPKLNFREGYCNLCEKCMAVCPTGALVPVRKNEIRLGMARIDEAICVAFLRSGCRICVDKCPEEAITAVKSNRLVIDGDRCNGCGLCENVCPVGRPKLFNFADRRAITVRRLEAGESRDDWRRG